MSLSGILSSGFGAVLSSLQAQWSWEPSGLTLSITSKLLLLFVFFSMAFVSEPIEWQNLLADVSSVAIFVEDCI